MKLFKKWRSDAKFRKNVIIGIIIIFLLGNFGGEKKEATQSEEDFCNTFNNDNGNLQNMDGCVKNNCIISSPELRGRNGDCVGITVIELFGGSSSLLSCHAIPLNPETDYLLGKTSIVAEECNFMGYDGVVQLDRYLCEEEWLQCFKKANPEDPLPGGVISGEACEYWQEPLAEIVDGVLKDNEMDCQTKAYLSMGLVIFAALMVI